MKSAPSRCPVTLSEASRKFERWRRSSRRGQRIPAPLWTLATELASEHGVSKTSRVLRLEYYALRKRVEATGARESEERGPTFVEVAVGSLSGLAPCVVELADERGVKLRVELPDRARGELGAVARMLWEAAR